MDELSKEQLLNAANTPRQFACTHHLIALKSLADQDWEAAQRHFSESVDAVAPFHEWHPTWSRAFLAQMQRDPNWPVGRSGE
jgi:hypothetical protein